MAASPPLTANQAASALIDAAAREQIVREIEGIGGGEVFFVGRLDGAMMVVEVEAYAFGNASTVPAVMQYARPGDVILHNHPSGHLEPSGADINLSSLAGERGVGSYIIDNACERVRIVVKAMAPARHRPLEAGAMETALGPEGKLARHIGQYEYRPSQMEMLRAVTDALNRDGLAVIEAPTGTGKSMAYLLPAVGWSLRNNERVVISTETINLQEQLIEKDLPLLKLALGLGNEAQAANPGSQRGEEESALASRDAVGGDFSAVLVKGRNNYLCRRKADYLDKHREFGADGEKQEQLDAILTWIKTTRDGSLSDLGFRPEPDVWERVMSEADNCLRTQCPFYQSCFYYGAKRRAARANVLVVNHHLLLADLALRAETENYTESAVLPPFQRIVLDEAHHLEDVATQYFGSRVSRMGLMMTLRRLAHPKTGDGLLHYLANQVYGGPYTFSPEQQKNWGARLTVDFVMAVREMEMLLDETAERTGRALARLGDANPKSGAPAFADSNGETSRELRRRITPEMSETKLWEREVRAPLLGLLKGGRELLQHLGELHQELMGAIREETPETLTPVMELRAANRKLERQLVQLARFLDEPGDRCRWIEFREARGNRPPQVAWCSAPLSISDDLRENLLRKYKTVVMTSATLAVGGKFDYFLKRIGAEDRMTLSVTGQHATAPEAGRGAQQRPLTTLVLESPFDFDRQVYVGVPVDLPSPTESGFEPALAAFLERSLTITEGRAFVLFTAYGMLGRLYDRVAPRLSGRGIATLRQGTLGRTQLTEAFRQDVGSVLFATSSFWEGVDVPGEALSCVVLTRLPFSVPDEPLMEARVEAMKQRGEDWFRELIVPRAVIRFRQGFGRLIRRKGDRGAVLICDNRVATMGYGQMFLKSLPTTRIHVAPAEAVYGALGAFFGAAESIGNG